MKPPYKCLLLLVAGLSTNGHAQTQKQIESRYSKDYQACLATGNAANGVTVAMMDCNDAEINRQDARLNQAYKMVMLRLNGSAKTTLRASERSWIGARDSRCARESASERGGSLENLIYSSCVLDETIKRTMWLEHYAG